MVEVVGKKPESMNDLPEHLRIKSGRDMETRGERFVHTFAHKWINFGLNYLLSISITDLHLGAEERNDGRPTSYIAHLAKGTFAEKLVTGFADWFKGVVHGLKAGAFTLVGGKGDVEKAEGLQGKVAGIVSDVFTLMLGGHITATLATLIQNRTDKFARRFDKMFDFFSSEKPTEEVLQQREERYEYLAEQPKISGLTTLKARGLGFVANLITGSGTAALHNWMMTKDRRDIAKAGKEELGARAITTALGDKVVTPIFHGISSAFLNHNEDRYNPASKGFENTIRGQRVKFWSEMALFETVCTLNTSLAHWVMTGGKKHGAKKEAHSTTSAPVSTASTTAKRDEKKISGNARSDEEAAPAEKAGEKKNWANERVSEKGDVKTHEERREAEAGKVHAFA